LSTFLLRRLVETVPVLVGITLVVFCLVRLMPGSIVDVMTAQLDIAPEQVEYLRQVYGVDRPLLPQYLEWLGQLAQGNLGVSLRTGRPIGQDLLVRLPVTLQLAAMATLISMVLALPLGVVAAVRQHSVVDHVARLFAVLGLAMPNFWLGTMLVLAVSFYLPALVPSGYVPFAENPPRNLQLMLLPALTLGLLMAGSVARVTRATVLEELRASYVATARAKGLHERAVVWRHVLQNALVPVSTQIGIQLTFLLGGTVIVEQIFALPGLGTLILGAINQRDYTTVQACVLVVALLVVLVNFATDVLYSYLDPRIRFG
jgi:peptide/nickel transport system permease protein